MKTNTTNHHKHHRPMHLHLEYFFRLRICLFLAAGLLAFMLVRSDRDVLAAMPQAYAEGAGTVGTFMSEERLHPHPALHVLRVPTISSGK